MSQRCREEQVVKSLGEFESDCTEAESPLTWCKVWLPQGKRVLLVCVQHCQVSCVQPIYVFSQKHELLSPPISPFNFISQFSL